MSSHLMNAYTRADIEIVRGEGVYAWDARGRRYLDFVGGMAVLALGHCHPAMIAALHRQAQVLWHASNIVRHPEQERLAARIAAASFADRVFFNNSGSEAVDLALKLVRRYFKSIDQPQRWRVITFDGAYHGRTMATIAASGTEKLTRGYEPLVEGFDAVPFGDLAGVQAAIGPETAAILLEPIQGDGGIRVAAPDFMRGLRELCDTHGLLLVLDEVQSGMGRTGKLFAHEWSGATPDIVAAAKGIGAGFPLGAVLATEAVGRTITPGSHGGTLAGAPLAMAVAHAVLDVMLADGFLDQVTRVGHRLRKGLSRVAGARPDLFVEARGVGLMLGLKCRRESGPVIAAFRNAGLLAAPASNDVIRFLPPLIVDDEEADQALRIINEVTQSLTVA